MLGYHEIKKLLGEVINLKPAFCDEMPPFTIYDEIYGIQWLETLYSHLNAIETLDDNTKAIAAKFGDVLIRVFLSMRRDCVERMGISYIEFPLVKINQICLKMAHKLRKQDESVCELLMSKMKTCEQEVLLYDTLKEATEDSEELTFKPQEYWISDNANRLFHLPTLLKYTASDTDFLFSSKERNKKYVYYGEYKLTLRDLINIKKVAGEASEKYFSALEVFHRQKQTTMYGLLKFFIKDLRASSVQGNGKESVADGSQLVDSAGAFFKI